MYIFKSLAGQFPAGQFSRFHDRNAQRPCCFSFVVYFGSGLANDVDQIADVTLSYI